MNWFNVLSIIGFRAQGSPDTTPVSATDPLPVTGTVTTGGLTEAQLRASAVPVKLNIFNTYDLIEQDNSVPVKYLGYALTDARYIVIKIDKTSAQIPWRVANVSNNATRTTFSGAGGAWTNRATLNFTYVFNLTGV